MNKSKGFTIIELIVVIAIIAVLAAIVLVNVTQYIAKGKDAAIKGNMSSMVTIGASWYDSHTSSYANIDNSTSGDSAFVAGIAAVEDANGGANDVTEFVGTDNKTFCVQTTLNDGSTWCVDSTGYKGGTLAGCDTGNATCSGLHP